MAAAIDTNVLVRFLTGDEAHCLTVEYFSGALFFAQKPAQTGFNQF